MTKTLTLRDANQSFARCIREVEAGEEFVITRNGTPVARLTAIEPAFDRDKARRAAAGLRRISREVTLGGLKIKDLVNEGRS